ncbi:MAG: hypothetical protein AW11_03986 [Candidatus Accumulibacter regalis]|jgi:hypothetical protein|uniref:Uncharacterized protein n=1 Tax=Accumulibacter regalis TaxID=522306 RepID=A0A011Q427_ACCRE|nr:MAG: hypothetical protein AW11_03986 [Candidatus Accumulibacter regalis]
MPGSSRLTPTARGSSQRASSIEGVMQYMAFAALASKWNAANVIRLSATLTAA